ncbi:MAG: nitrate reductase cytochrome c-type subunit [Dehalococcoidales bacterium]|nr:nitrate reductase cytochrome c-type subunit [Dehalococcoidales bacterium]
MKKLYHLALPLAVMGLLLLWGCALEQPKPAPTPRASAPAAKDAASADKEQPATPPRSVPAAQKPGTPEAEAKKPDSGAYTHQSLATGSPGMNRYDAPPPGRANKVDRAYPGAPPVIPHSLNGLAITKDSNSCVGCHSTGMEVAPGHVATKIPDSHYVDPKTATKGSQISGTRYVCLSCHVPQSPDKQILETRS